MWLGIDFGTCLSSAALMIDNNVRLVKDPDQSGFSIPSSVYVTESGEIRIGHAAENLRRQNPSFYRREFKRDLGTTNPYILGNRELSPEELAAEVIKELKKEADEMIRGRGLLPIDNAVITVPATYQLHKRNLMELAGKKAGFQQVKLLEEPVAAAVYYTNYNRRKEEQYQEENILVYDLGGGTFDATLIQKTKNKYEILSAPVGLTHCGGIDFDRKIFDDIYKRCSSQLRELLNRHNRTPDAELGRLLVSDFCRQFKHKLGREIEHKDILDAGNIPYEEYSLSRDVFNSMISPLIAETIEQCNRLVESAGIGWDAVNQVLLVGGSCRIPYVKTVVEKEFKRPVFLVDDPELAVCQGAAIYAVNELSPTTPTTPPPPPPNGKTKSTQWDYFYSL